MRVEAVLPLEALVGSIWFNSYDPTVMLGIWHGGDWLKEKFGSKKFIVRWYEEVIDLVRFYANKSSFPLVFT